MTEPTTPTTVPPAPSAANPASKPTPAPAQPPGEIGGPRGLEPTRFGDWDIKGRCSDF